MKQERLPKFFNPFSPKPSIWCVAKFSQPVFTLLLTWRDWYFQVLCVVTICKRTSLFSKSIQNLLVSLWLVLTCFNVIYYKSIIKVVLYTYISFSVSTIPAAVFKIVFRNSNHCRCLCVVLDTKSGYIYNFCNLFVCIWPYNKCMEWTLRREGGRVLDLNVHWIFKFFFDLSTPPKVVTI